MTKRPRRIRHAVGTALLWGFWWSWVGNSVIWFFTDLRGAVNLGNEYAVMDLVGGAAFSVGRRRFAEMSLPLFAVWGAVAGLLLSLPMFVGNLDLGSGLGNAAIVGGVGLMSAGCAAGLLGRHGTAGA